MGHSVSRAFRGVGALEVALDLGPSGERRVGVSSFRTSGPSELPPGGTKVTFHVWLPAGHRVTSVQAFVLYYPQGEDEAEWHGQAWTAAQLPGGQWTPISIAVPAAAGRVAELGLAWRSTEGWRGMAYVDAVSW